MVMMMMMACEGSLMSIWADTLQDPAKVRAQVVEPLKAILLNPHADTRARARYFAFTDLERRVEQAGAAT